MSGILIVGHCKPGPESPHKPLYEQRENQCFPLEGVEYLDTMQVCPEAEGQFRKWAEVPHNSKDILYPWNCPLYLGIFSKRPLYGECKQMWTNLLVDGHAILRSGGVIVVPTTKDMIPLPAKSIDMKGTFLIIKDSAKEQIENVEQIVAELAPGNWRVKYVAKYPLILAKRSKNSPSYPCLVIERLDRN
jgi:hypothetical protein